MKALISAPPVRQRFQHLPREARDTLFLLGVIGLITAPHAGHLPLWCSAMAAVILFWRALLALRGAALPGRTVLITALLATAARTLITYRTLLGREAGITLLVVLLALKTLELRARRDAFVVFFLGFFLVLTQSLYGQSIAVAVWMIVSVWAMLTSLVLAQMPAGRPPLARAAWAAARTTALGLPLMVLLFVIFPRIGPLWGVPDQAVGRTGLSNNMTFGNMAEIALDDSIAMRLRFEGRAPESAHLYFRGPVLTRFDGRRWSATPAVFQRTQGRGSLEVQGQPIQYEVTLEPLRISSMPLLESSPGALGSSIQVDSLRLTRATDLQWLAERTITERLRFQATAYTRFSYQRQSNTPDLQEALELPANANPRTLIWAQALRTSMPNAAPDDLVQRVLKHLHDGEYYYTLSPGVYGKQNPHVIDEFWFERRAGFCEHFAGAFVVVMRAMGVPTRIVTGYQGVDPVQQDGYYVVRQSHAHAWAEYWTPEQGWQRADPTAAVAPERVLQSRQLRPEPGVVASALSTMSPELLTRLRGTLELINNRWNQWVLNYSRGQQFELLRQLGVEQPSWQDLAQFSVVLLTGLSLIAVALTAWSTWRERRGNAWHRQHEKLLHQMRKLGLAAAPHHGPRTLAAMVGASFGTQDQGLALALLELERQRYAPTDLALAASAQQLFAQAQSCARALLKSVKGTLSS